MKSYTITVNGNVYDVTVEENTNGAPAAAPAPSAAAPAPAAKPASAAGTAGSISITAGAAGKVVDVVAAPGAAVPISNVLLCAFCQMYLNQSQFQIRVQLLEYVTVH